MFASTVDIFEADVSIVGSCAKLPDDFGVFIFWHFHQFIVL
jgi:hypothetical protein